MDVFRGPPPHKSTYRCNQLSLQRHGKNSAGMKLPKFLNFWKRRHQAVCSFVLANFPTAVTKENPTRRSVQKVFGDKNEASVGQPAAASIANETAPASVSAAPSCPWYTLCPFAFFLSCAFLLSAWSLNHKSLPWLGLACRHTGREHGG